MWALLSVSSVQPLVQSVPRFLILLFGFQLLDPFKQYIVYLLPSLHLPKSFVPTALAFPIFHLFFMELEFLFSMTQFHFSISHNIDQNCRI